MTKYCYSLTVRHTIHNLNKQSDSKIYCRAPNRPLSDPKILKVSLTYLETMRDRLKYNLYSKCQTNLCRRVVTQLCVPA